MNMPEMKRTGTFTAAASAAAVFVDLGWQPDIVTITNEVPAGGGVARALWDRGTMGEAKCYKETAAASTGAITGAWLSSGGITSTNTSVLQPQAWKASQAYSVGDIVHPTTLNGYFYKCTTAGTSNSTEPTWGTTAAGTTSDNSATWTCYKEADLPVQRVGKKGFTIPAALQIASTPCYWTAERIDKET